MKISKPIFTKFYVHEYDHDNMIMKTIKKYKFKYKNKKLSKKI